jgi:hypothetical protein
MITGGEMGLGRGKTDGGGGGEFDRRFFCFDNLWKKVIIREINDNMMI